MIGYLQLSPSLVVGGGVTGMSTLRFMQRHQVPVKLFSDELSADCRSNTKEISDAIPLYDRGNGFDEIFEGVESVVLSPGVPLNHPLVMEAAERSIEVIGDVELFARNNIKPVLAVTGSNGKSTVVTLVRNMLEADGKRVVLAGNIGEPVLDCLEQEAEYVVLELSSFQLDITHSLEPRVGCILNISADHLDRYDNLKDYISAKQRIYHGAQVAVYNRQDPETSPESGPCEFRGALVSFGINKPKNGDYGVIEDAKGNYLVCGERKLLRQSELALNRQVDVENALAAYAIASEAGVSQQAINEVLRSFRGLAHRCELVLEHGGTRWVNDSKATNVGACKAALKSFGDESVILIAGGDSKNADISILRPEIESCVKAIVGLGLDADLFEDFASKNRPFYRVSDMRSAVEKARELVSAGDVVLLSPACSSLDMYTSYQERGELFNAYAREVVC